LDCWKEVAETRSFVSGRGEMYHGLSKQSSVSLPSLHVPQPPTFPESSAATPSPMSAISNVSSGSSSFHLGSLILDSPNPWTTGLPVAGPSGIGREQPQVQGVSCYHLVFHMLIEFAYHHCSAQVHAVQCIRASMHHCQATIQCSECGWVPWNILHLHLHLSLCTV
jgi:hypothetical protein